MSAPISPEAEFVYTTSDGTPFILKKKFRLPDGSKRFEAHVRSGIGWKLSKGEIKDWPLYRLDKVLISNIVLIFEGEGDAERVEAASAQLGFPEGAVVAVTTAPNGAQSWREEYGYLLAKKVVIIIPDMDEAGEKYLAKVMRCSLRYAAMTRVVRLPDGKDVSEFLDRHPVEELAALIKTASLVTPDSTAPELNIITLADVEAREVDWLSRPYIPWRMVTMLSGDPGSGKSFIAMYLAAQLSRGRLPGCKETAEPITTLYLTRENPLPEVMRPRFDALGGDPRYCKILTGANTVVDGKEVCLAVTLDDVDMLRRSIQQTGARLLVIDPVQSYFGADVDLHRANETRPIMDGLVTLAQETGVAILILRHLSKSGTGSPLYRGLGSIDLTGAVRSELMAGCLPNEPNARALVHIKSNVGPLGKSMSYSIDADGNFRWNGTTSLTAVEMLAAPEVVKGSKVDAAERWLQRQLAGGEKAVKELEAEGKFTGFSWSTVERAAENIKVQTHRAGFVGGWYWSLPKAIEQSMMSPMGDSQDTQRENLLPFDKNKGKSARRPN